jgi:hypothetical protein
VNEYEAVLLTMALITAALSRKLPRAWLWIFAGFCSFVLSAVYWRLGLPHHPAFTAFADSSVCLAIYFNARERWEMGLYKVFQLSVLISLLKLGGFMPDGLWYPAALELINVAALLLISGTAIFAGAAHGIRSVWHRNDSFYRSLFPLRAARTTPPFHKVR